MRITAAYRALVVVALFASCGPAPRPLAAAPPPAPAERDGARQLPLYATRQNVFAIPFAVDRRVAHPVEVHLYVSTDQGTTWQLSARETPSARQFTFRSRNDGEYWFASRTLDANQATRAQGTLQPELRVVVDTVPPQVDFGVRTDAEGQVLAAWQAADQNLLANSLKIEYQEDAAQPWRPVSVPQPAEHVVRTNYQGQTTWKPDTRSPTINIRAEVRDRAGNLAVVNRRLLLPRQTTSGQSGGTENAATVSDPFARAGQPSEGAVAWPSDNMVPRAVVSREAQPGTGPSAPAMPPPAPTEQVQNQFASTHVAPATTGSGPVNPSESPSVPNAPSLAGPPPAAPAPSLPVDPASPVAVPAEPLSPDLSPLATSPTPPGPAASSLPASLPVGERPQMTNATRFQLAYDVDAVGPSGVAEVQLWATPDGGQTWRLWGTDEDLKSPFDVVVEEEGVFGFHVVVVGRNGLAGRKPRMGDPADIYIGVDTQSPVAKLTAAAYGDGAQAGRLVIRWEVSDPNLDPRPIALKFSEHPEGPWTVIASALPNSGEFAWPADAQVPAAVYLRVEARDEAGNLGADQLAEPVRMDGLAPKARIRSVQPILDADREAFRQPRRK